MKFFAAAGIGCLLVTSSCKKNVADGTLIISSISPSSGPYSTAVTISGSGFSANPAENKVEFNGVEAVVQTASATGITALVPKTAGTGPVTVRKGIERSSGPVFDYTYTVAVSTLAGNKTPGHQDGNGTAAAFDYPSGLACDAQGNIFVSEENCIRKITPAGIVTTFAGSTEAGYADGDSSKAKFNSPAGITIDRQGNVYVADVRNFRIRKITPAQVVSTFAGSGQQGFQDGAKDQAQFKIPFGICVDRQNNVYVTDGLNQLIRRITPGGMVSTWAGTGDAGLTNGPASKATFNNPIGIALGLNDTIYVTEGNNDCIRKIAPSGIVSTWAGNGVRGFRDGPKGDAEFLDPRFLAFDARGNAYLADANNNRIRMITVSGTVITLAGSDAPGLADGNTSGARFNFPLGVACDPDGTIYVTDCHNQCIRKIKVE